MRMSGLEITNGAHRKKTSLCFLTYRAVVTYGEEALSSLLKLMPFELFIRELVSVFWITKVV